MVQMRAMRAHEHTSPQHGPTCGAQLHSPPFTSQPAHGTHFRWAQSAQKAAPGRNPGNPQGPKAQRPFPTGEPRCNPMIIHYPITSSANHIGSAKVAPTSPTPKQCPRTGKPSTPASTHRAVHLPAPSANPSPTCQWGSNMTRTATLKEKLVTLPVGAALSFKANEAPTLHMIHKLCVQLRINLVPKRVGDDIRLERVA